MNNCNHYFFLEYQNESSSLLTRHICLLNQVRNVRRILNYLYIVYIHLAEKKIMRLHETGFWSQHETGFKWLSPLKHTQRKMERKKESLQQEMPV